MDRHKETRCGDILARFALLICLPLASIPNAMADECKVVGSYDAQNAAVKEIKEIANISALRGAVNKYRPFDWKLCYPNTSENKAKFPFVFTSTFNEILKAVSPQLLDEALSEKLFDANEDVPSSSGVIAAASVPKCLPDAKTYVECDLNLRSTPLHILMGEAAPSYFRMDLKELEAPLKIEVFVRHGADTSRNVPNIGTPLDSYVGNMVVYRTRDQQPAAVFGFIDAASEAGWIMTNRALLSSIVGTPDLTRAVLKHYHLNNDAVPPDIYALYGAAWAGNLETARILVEAGLDPEAKSIKQADGTMTSPMDAAVIQNKVDVVAYFRSLGGNHSGASSNVDALSEEQLIGLAASGLSSDSILKLVRSKGLAFELDTDATIRLSRKKLPSALLAELQLLHSSKP